MLKAYFDDSGTHTGGKSGPSKIVLVAGIFGTETQLKVLDRSWRKHLASPLDGRKPPLKRFHAYDCDNSIEEFLGWTRTETDYLCHQLQTAIIESGVAAYGVAVSRKDWDDLVTGDTRGFFGDAEGYCISQCFVRSIQWAKETTHEPAMAFVFDQRTPEIHRRAGAISSAFQQHTSMPQLLGTAFLSSAANPLLQAADMIAWELYQHANDVLNNQATEPKRTQLKRLSAGMYFPAQIAVRSSIERLVEYAAQQDPQTLKQLANHFTFYDPEKPDYSYLNGKRPS